MSYVFEKKSDCCGCGLCKEICPHHAISMVPDDEGFRYPVIDKEKCTNCGACKRVCSFRNGPDHQPLAYYAARHTDPRELARSSSGGVFVAIAKVVLDRGGVIFGAVFTDEWLVVHAQANTLEELRPMHGSKYLPSNIDFVYHSIEKLLKSNRPVLFTGVPCQVSAIRKWLQFKHVLMDNFYAMDILCHAVASPTIWMEYLRMFQERYGEKPFSLSFRNKELGWSTHCISIRLSADQDITKEWAKQLDFFKLWNSQYINRPSCYTCPYAHEKRTGDFSCGDFVGIEKLHYEKPVEEGVSILSVNTEKAQDLLPELPLDLLPVTRQQCVQQAMDYPAAAPRGRQAFWQLYREKGFSAVVKKYGKMTIEKKVIYHIIVPICKKLGIYQIAAKIYLKK